MSKFKKSEKTKKSKESLEPLVVSVPLKPLEPVTFTPQDAGMNMGNTPLSPPKTEYELRRTSIGLDAYRQVTGK